MMSWLVILKFLINKFIIIASAESLANTAQLLEDNSNNLIEKLANSN